MVKEAWRWSSIVIRVLIKKSQEGHSRTRRWDSRSKFGMMALKMEEGAMSQGKLAASRSWKKETDFPLKPPEGCSPANNLILA